MNACSAFSCRDCPFSAPQNALLCSTVSRPGCLLLLSTLAKALACVWDVADSGHQVNVPRDSVLDPGGSARLVTCAARGLQVKDRIAAAKKASEVWIPHTSIDTY